jgi:excisionase family DNA binding protein
LLILNEFDMSSNIRVKRICQHCKAEFEAKTTVTKFCSHRCASAAHKARIRNASLEMSNIETSKLIPKVGVELYDKVFLTVNDVAKLLNSSKQAIYNMIDSGKLPATKLSERKTLIRRVDVDQLFVQPQLSATKLKTEEKELKLKDCYTMAEAIDVSGMSGKALYQAIARENISKKQVGKYVYVPKSAIHKLLSL